MLVLCTTGLASSQIHPVIVENCTKCHGGVKQKGGLDLRTLACRSSKAARPTPPFIPGAPLRRAPFTRPSTPPPIPTCRPKSSSRPTKLKALEHLDRRPSKSPRQKKLVLPDYRNAEPSHRHRSAHFAPSGKRTTGRSPPVSAKRHHLRPPRLPRPPRPHPHDFTEHHFLPCNDPAPNRSVTSSSTASPNTDEHADHLARDL